LKILKISRETLEMVNSAKDNKQRNMLRIEMKIDFLCDYYTCRDSFMVILEKQDEGMT
jgi:hypothetical protein